MTVHRRESTRDEVINRTEQCGSRAGERPQAVLRRAQEEDRARVAQTIHDHLGFLMMLLRMRLQVAKERIGRLSDGETMSASMDAVLTELTAAETVWQQLWAAARQLQNDLRPAPLDSHGLAVAFSALRRTFAGAGLIVGLSVDALVDKRFSTNLETTAYWLTQHALTNALRHSGTNHAVVTANIVRRRDGQVVHIVIADRGKGFTIGRIGSTFGLTAMYDRAALIGGTVIVESALGRGTRVIIDLPTDVELSHASARKES